MAKEIQSPYVEAKDPRFSEKEVELLGLLEESTLKLFRLVFFQKELSEIQRANLQKLLTPDMIAVLRKIFYTRVDWNEPMFGVRNRWTMPRFEQVLTSETKPIVIARQRAIKWLQSGLDRLEDLANGGKGEPKEKIIDMDMEKDYADRPESEVKIEALAMQEAHMTFESDLVSLFQYAQGGKEKIKEIQDRLKKDSMR